MEDLSHIVVPKMHVTEGFPVLPQSVMDGFSAQDALDHASRMIGLSNDNEEVADEGPESHGG